MQKLTYYLLKEYGKYGIVNIIFFTKRLIMAKENKSKIYRLFYDNRFVLLSSGCAALVMLLVYFCYNVIPFGDMTVLRMDLYHQYGPLFGELYERIMNLDSLFYSWKSGLGGGFLGNYYNYLSSPLSIIIVLLGHKNVPQAIAALILLKAALSAGTFTYYLKKTFSRHDFATAGFGLLYAFCGWFVAYYWNVMWIDALVLFPLVMLGIQKIIDEGKPWLFCISLAVSLFATYYMGYMMCIFSVLYFLVYYFSNYSITDHFINKLYREKGNKKLTYLYSLLTNSRFFRSGIRFAFFSVFAVLLTAISLIPVYYALKACSATSGTFPTEYKSYFSIFDFLANHIACLNPTIRSSGEDVLPNVYCGILTVMLVPFYLFCKKISIKEKAIHIGLLLVLFLSFNVNFANYVWHGFHFPNDLPYRFSFMYSFILIVIAFKAFMNIKEFSSKHFLAVGIGVMAFVVLVEKIESKNVSDLSIWITLAIVGLYVFVLSLFKNKNYQYAIVSVLLLCSIGSEIALSNTNNYSMGQSRTNYIAGYDDFQTANEQLKQYDDGFYRVEQTNLRTRMDDSWLYYNGSSTFSSMAYEKTSNMMRDLGFSGNYINSYTYYPQTAVYNAMFNIKYLFDNDNALSNPDIYKSLFANTTYTVYENNYTLPVVFSAASEVKDFTTNSSVSPFVLQSALFEAASGVANVFSDIPIDYVSYNNVESFYPAEIESGRFYVQKSDSESSGSFTIEITVPVRQNVYIYLKARSVKSLIATGTFFSKTQTLDGKYYILDLGMCEANEIINIEASIGDDENSETMDFYAVGLNMDNFVEGYEILNKSAMNITEYSDTLLKGTVNAEYDGCLFTSIPYDKGWSIYIDGVKTDYYAINEALIGLNITAGEHTVEFKFVPQGFVIGACVSAIALIAAVFMIIVYNKSNRIKRYFRTGYWQYDNASEDIDYAIEQIRLENTEEGFRIIDHTIFDEDDEE